MPPKKKTSAKAIESAKTSTVTCCVCCQSLNPAKDEALFCTGSCQQWAHRYCAGVSVMAYKVIKEKGYQFRCFACHQILHQDEITKLEDEIARLSSLVSDMKSTPVSDPTVPGSYASAAATAVTTGESGDHSIKVTKPPIKVNTYEPSRKFNIVIFGIGECRQGAKRPERLAFDLSMVESVLVDIDGSLKSSSIKDCYRLGRYRADQEKPRPILVKLVRIEEVSKVLANRWAVKSPIVVKPDMTRDERIRESTLLKHRWNLIKSGIPKQAIKISRAKIFVNNVEYGAYSQSGFVLASDRPVQPIPPVDEHPNNHSPDTLSKTTSQTTISVSSIPDAQPLVTIDPTQHSTAHCQSLSPLNVPVSPPPDQSNPSSPTP